jgi:hypothetical protein
LWLKKWCSLAHKHRVALLTNEAFSGYISGMDQKHLDRNTTVNYGSFYTPEWVVDIVYALLEKNIPDVAGCRILDTLCGYGGFLRGADAVGADIDGAAVNTARERAQSHTYYCHNSLSDIARARYNITENEKLVIVGNPPCNDTTSIIQNKIKQSVPLFERDRDVVARNIGIPFLLSYDKLKADYICVLHPLSYLIKKANFESLKCFTKHYRLTDSMVISSGAFSDTSKTTHFPILIGFYERCASGMDYDYITQYQFDTFENKLFSLRQYDTVGNYITKYTNKKSVSIPETAAHFYTMRDINALKRTVSFTNRESGSTIRVTRETLPYYCYVDVFKDCIPHIPHYFGNSDIMINNDMFMELRDVFVSESSRKHPGMIRGTGYIEPDKQRNHNGVIIIERYFRALLGEHYVETAPV